MEDESTQPSTYPLLQGERNGSSDTLSLEDELDIICLLRPCSKAAFDITEKIARSHPRHVLKSGGIPNHYRRVIEVADRVESGNRPSPAEDALEVTPDLAEIDMTDYNDSDVADIALRLSSRVIDMDMGFIFGRDPRKCDIVLSVDDKSAARISGMHFRIYLSDNGNLFAEDTSTNGTLVDNFLMKAKLPSPGNSVRRIIQKGSVIAVFVKADRTTARFIVDIPQRRDEMAWRGRLEQYMSAVRRARHQKVMMLKNLGTDKAGSSQRANRLPAPAIPPFSEVSPADNMFLTAGTTPWNHGMRWNGDGRFNVIAKLGSGAFATVYKLVEVNTGVELAAKEIEKRRFMKNGVLDMKITSELDILKRLKHPYVIESFDHVDTTRDLYILMELVPYGDLSVHVGTSDKLNDRDMRLIAKQMCQALAYLHDNGIAHRDIKPENIIKKRVKPLWIKLADFGLSKIITQDDHQTAYQTFCGTLLYCAPEVYPGFALKRAGLPPDPRRTKPSPYSTAVDIWSLSAVLFHLLCAKPPYEASAANHGIHMLDRIFEERFPRRKFDDAEVHPDWETFFENTLQLTAQQRWSARRLLNMSWMRAVEDIVPVQYEFKNPGQDFALEDVSSDEDMDDFGDTSNHLLGIMPEESSQLSLNNDPHSEDDDYDDDGDSLANEGSIPDLESAALVTGGLGIKVQGRQPSASVYYPQLRGEQASSNHAYVQSNQLDGASDKPDQRVDNYIYPAQGKLFGEITESGVFGSVNPAPRIIDDAHRHRIQPPRAASSVISSKHRRNDQDVEEEHGILTSPKRSRIYGSRHSEALASAKLLDPSTECLHINWNPQVGTSIDRKSPQTYDIYGRDPETGNDITATCASKQTFQNTVAAGNLFSGPSSSPPALQNPGLGPEIQRGSIKAQTAIFDIHGLSMANSSRPPTPHRAYESETKVLGQLVPGRKSVKEAKLIYVIHQSTQFGRAPECTNVYSDVMDTRCPKSAFTILLHDPAGNDLDPAKDWTRTNFYAVIGTRCSGYILINNIPMTRNKTQDNDYVQLGLLQSGDIIEVFDKPDGHLRYHVHFWFGAARHRRDNSKDPFKVVLGEKAIHEVIMQRESGLFDDTSIE